MKCVKAFVIVSFTLFILLFAFLSPVNKDSITWIGASNKFQFNATSRNSHILNEENKPLQNNVRDKYIQTNSRVSVSRTISSTVHMLRIANSPMTAPHMPELKSVGTLSTYQKTVTQHMSTVDTKIVRESCEKSWRNPTGLILSKSEERDALNCSSNYSSGYSQGNSIWRNGRAAIRWLHHTYLNMNSLVMDIGGNTGIDAKNIISRFHPKQYLILEPVNKFYDHLVKMFINESSVLVFKYGAGEKKMKLNVSIAGTNGDATSVFKKSNNKTNLTEIQIRSVAEIFQEFRLSCTKQLDLLTINCEGCEFEVIETLLKTNLLSFVKNLQFATHSTLQYLKDPIKRYCKMQQLLSRTHKLTYQYKFVWESWRRKDLITM